MLHVSDANSCSKECLSQLKVSDEAALDAYRRLQALLSSLKPLQDDAEGAAPHLLDHVAGTTQRLHQQIRDAFSAELDSVLEEIRWPRPDASIPISLHQDWAETFGKLLDLQKPALQERENGSAGNKDSRAPLALLPLQVLAQPLEMRFRYHFEGDRPTNRLDKPEYFLSHVLDLLGSYSAFVIDNVQPLLLKHFRGTDLALNSVYIDAISAWVTALLPILRAKIFSMLPKVSSQPQLLSHLMHEIMRFDTTIRDEWRYDGGYGVEGWKGLAWEVLVQKDYFDRWLQVEKDCKCRTVRGITRC